MAGVTAAMKQLVTQVDCAGEGSAGFGEKMKRIVLAAVLVFGIQVTASADAVFYPSYSLTNNNAADVASGLAAVQLVVSATGDPSKVDFRFENTHDEAVVTDIWFDNERLLPTGVLGP